MRAVVPRLALVLLAILNAEPIATTAQLRPPITAPAKKKKAAPKKPEKPAEAKPSEIVIQTSPNAEVYLDDQFRGRASAEGRLVIENPKPGDHTLRVSLAGKKDYEQRVTVVEGQTQNLKAQLGEISRRAEPSPTGPTLPVQPVATAGIVRENPKDGLKYVWIQPGTFMMGCSPGDDQCQSDEKPAHQVTITKGFWMGQTEVTVGAYKRFAATAGRQMPEAPSFNSGWANDSMPIVNVSWDDAQAFCQWAGGRLPTEAEWEYAARAGSTEARYGPFDAEEWYNKNSPRATREVAQKRANAFGLYDMLGNVWEWVNDWYDNSYYQNSPNTDPPGPPNGQDRVSRGGSSYYSMGGKVRVSYRYGYSPDYREDNLGCRCVREVGGP